MLIGTKSKYALIAMIHLAKSKGGKAISLTELSRRQGISASYMEKIFHKLQVAELVCSVRGPKGGFTIPEKEISVEEIVRAVECDDIKACNEWDCVKSRVSHDLHEIKISSFLI